MRKKYHVTSCMRARRLVNVDNDMDEKNDPRRYGSRFKNERVKSRNLSEKKRRDQFNMLINELCTMVSSNNRKMDKSSVLRSAISFLRNHRDMSVQQHNVEIQENWKPPFLSNEEFTHLMLEALDGYIMVFSCTGEILYTSESIASLLGYLPSDISSSVFDMVHECDRSDLYKLINSPSENVLSIVVHMKRGPIYSQNSYESVRLIGSFHHWPSSSSEGSSMCNIECDSNSCSSICSPLSSATVDWPLCFVAMAQLQTPQLLRVVSLPEDSKKEFISRHSLEWTFLFLDHRAPPIIGYLPFEVLGTSGYDYYHVDDLEAITTSHENLMHTGEGTSCYYRFLTKGQQWVWLQTRYYISYHQWNSKPEFIVCTNVVINHETVQNALRKLPKKSSNTAKKIISPNPNFHHNKNSCLSPAPSTSSLGSHSSDHSGRGVTPMKSHPVLYSNQEDTHSTPKKTFEQPETSNHIFALPKEVTPQPDIVTQPNFFNNPVPSSETQCQTISSAQSPVIMNPSQAQLQDYLKRRHQALQQQILMQQEELRRVSEQLMLVQFAGSNNISPPFYPPPPTENNIIYQPSRTENRDMEMQNIASTSYSQPEIHVYTSQGMDLPSSTDSRHYTSPNS